MSASKIIRNRRRSAPQSLHADYVDLLENFPLRSIRNDAEYDSALEILDTLATQSDLSPGERDYLDALSVFVERYDEAEHVIDHFQLSPLELLKFLMEQHTMTTTDLGKVLGSKGVASEVLHGKRSLSISASLKLSKLFDVNPGLFLDASRTLSSSDTRREMVRVR